MPQRRQTSSHVNQDVAAKQQPNPQALRAAFFAETQDPGQFTRIFDQLSDIIFFAKDRHFRLMLCNANFYRRFGFQHENDIIGHNDYELFPRTLADKYRADDQYILDTGEPILNIIELFLSQHGIPDWFITQKIPLLNGKGIPCGVAGVIQRYDLQKNISAASSDIADAANAFRADPGQRWRMEDVARGIGLSQRQFDRKFKSCFGVTPQNYLMKTRIQAACDALRQPHADITDIAITLGFYDQSAFTAQFNRIMGITPLKYQRQFRV